MIQRISMLVVISVMIVTGCVEKDVTLITPTPILTSTPAYTPQPKASIPVTGIVADCSYPYASKIGISNATISYAGNTTTTTDKGGHFSLSVLGNEPDPILEITAPGYMPYRERLSRMVNGAFYLIPKGLYRGVYLVLWNPEPSNPQNWHRKWEQQTEFVIVQTGASEKQINTLRAILTTDEYRKMTGGRFTSNITPTLVKEKPMGNERVNKTVVSFSSGIGLGGIAHSEDYNGIIYYAEITYDTIQILDSTVVWHEMVHTVTAGGHINEWPSVVSEVQGTNGKVTETDEKIFNCIYNSPPLRSDLASETDIPSSILTPISVPQPTGENFTNSIGMEFVQMPAGEFDMGSPFSEKYRDFSEGPVHRVKFTKAFYMGKYEVTQKQWREIMGNNPSYFKDDDRPVEQVSWNDIQEFIKKLNEREGTNKYRLPSEAEWEYAARAGTNTMYSFGNNESELGDYAWYEGNSGGKTHPVGQKRSNSWGLYDMHGNVWEWVQDKFHDNYNFAPTNGSAWESGNDTTRVERGGNWRRDAARCRLAIRAFDLPDGRFKGLGFRLARDL